MFYRCLCQQYCMTMFSEARKESFCVFSAFIQIKLLLVWLMHIRITYDNGSNKTFRNIEIMFTKSGHRKEFLQSTCLLSMVSVIMTIYEPMTYFFFFYLYFYAFKMSHLIIHLFGVILARTNGQYLKNFSYLLNFFQKTKQNTDINHIGSQTGVFVLKLWTHFSQPDVLILHFLRSDILIVKFYGITTSDFHLFTKKT